IFERMTRTHMAGSLRKEHIGTHVTIAGWVDKNRDLGGVLFFDVRDREGIAQCVVRPEDTVHSEAAKLRGEFVVRVSGIVRERENKNSKIPSGDIEIVVETL